MTPEEVAALYRVQPSTVKRWARERKVRARKVMGMWRFDRSEVLADIELIEKAAS